MTLEHHQIIPYDIVYKVYFYINDYCTLTKFWGLCKPFYKYYMKKYKQSYKHKYNIIYNDLFFFLTLLPDTDYANINSNIKFYTSLVEKSSWDYKDDIKFIYRLYKVFFIKYFTILKLDYDLYKECERLTSILLMQGPKFINGLVNVEFKWNKILIKPVYTNRYDMLNHIVLLCNKEYQSVELISSVQKIDNMYKYFI